MPRAARLLLVCLALVAAGCGGDDEDATTLETTTTAEATGRGGPGVTVGIRDFAFEPQEIRVTVGEEVTWRNDGAAEHTVVADGAAGPRSPTLGTGDTFTWRAGQAGAVAYLCSIHPNMTGRVVVEE